MLDCSMPYLCSLHVISASFNLSSLQAYVIKWESFMISLQGKQPILCMWWWWLWYTRWRPVKFCLMNFTPHRYSFGCWIDKFQSSCHWQRHSSKITMYLVTCSLVTAYNQSHIQVHTLNRDNFKPLGSSETGMILNRTYKSWTNTVDI